MCNYFSCIFRPDGVINFTETNSHEDTIDRLKGICCDDSQFSRSFLRIECEGGHIEKFVIDESLDSLPSWYYEHEQEYRDKLEKLLKRINKIEAKRDALHAEYAAKRAPLYAEYAAKRNALDAEYAAKRNALYAEYAAKRNALYADYEAKCTPLDADYKAKCAPLDKELSKIPGFVAKLQMKGKER